MPIPPQEAAGALHDVERAERRSARAYGYQKASPHLIMWGVIWIIGYATNYLRPHWSGTWLVLFPAGMIASFWIGRGRAGQRSRSLSWRYWTTAAAILLFSMALFAIMPPKSGVQAGAFFPLLVALYYTIFGIWKDAARMAVLGLALGVLTLAGFFWLPQFFLLWMAGVGGGALILGGFWLRGI